MRRLILATTLLLGLVAVPSAAAQDAGDGPRVIAADGTVAALDAINPPSRTAGLLALYTPEFGATTGTNVYGAEAVLRATDDPEVYEVIDVCTVWGYFAGECDNPGDNPIPADGAVLSAAPGGDPDVRLFIRDHIAKGDRIRVIIPITRTASRPLDAVDPTPETNPDGVDPGTGECYPGCRGANQLIQYTPAFGERTGTNQFGYEITVVDGRVVARGGNDNPIPDDGYVLSGHGEEGTWLAANSIIGARVEIADGVVTITIDASAYVFAAAQEIEKAAAALTAARETCAVIPADAAANALDEARSLLADAEAALEAGDERAAVNAAEAATAAAQTAWARTLESDPVEGRGLWVRPTETTRPAIAADLDRVARSGVNHIFLETFWNGSTIFLSDAAAEAGVIAQSPTFAEAGIDALAVWIEEAHARDIEVHAWVENFFVGNDASVGVGPILEVHAEWAAVEYEDVGADGPRPSSREPGYYFLDPAIPEARQYLLDIYAEMLAEYEIDGLHLDYIRYPVSLPLEASFSYSDYSREAFAAEYGVDPYTLTPDDAAWEDWNAWREANITSFVGEVRALVDELRPDATLSAAVFPDEFDSQVRKLQNWADWARRGWMDVLNGMSFGRSAEPVAADTEAMREIVDGRALISTGVYAPFLGLDAETLLRQVEGVRDAGGHGVALFSELQLTDGQVDALAEGVFRAPALAPHRDPVGAVAHGLHDLADRVDEHYGPCMAGRDARHLQRAAEQAARMLERAQDEPRAAAGLLRAADQRLAAAARHLDRADIEPALRDRLHQELSRYRDILTWARQRT